MFYFDFETFSFLNHKYVRQIKLENMCGSEPGIEPTPSTTQG